MIPAAELTWDRERFPLADRNQFRVHVGEGWQVLRDEDDQVQGVSGPSAHPAAVVCFTLPTGVAISPEDRLWRAELYAGVFNLLKANPHRDVTPLDVPLAAVVTAVPEGLVGLVLDLHERYARELEDNLSRALEIVGEAHEANLADSERRAELMGRTMGMGIASSCARLLMRAQDERDALKPLLGEF